METATANGRTSNRAERRTYTGKPRKLRLIFEDTGLVVLLRSVSVGTVMEIAELAGDGSVAFTPEGVKDLGRMFEILAEALVKWNHERDFCRAHDRYDCAECGCEEHADLVCEDCGFEAAVERRPTPASFEGICSLDIAEALTLIKRWVDAAAGVAGGSAGPLEPDSTGGAQSPVASLPMEALSPSHQS